MKAYIAIGSNLGNRRAHFEAAANQLAKDPRVKGGKLRVSPIYETPALLPAGAPTAWRLPYLNAVIEMDWSSGAQELLGLLKRIETSCGRSPSEKWSPRELDLDILIFGGLHLHETAGEGRLQLEIPHPGLSQRSFVLDPLKDLCSDFINNARLLKTHAPLWMGVLNLTPDSFSGDGLLKQEVADDLAIRCTEYEEENVQLFDLGGESTRPGAVLITPDEEWRRLEPALQYLRARYKDRFFKPLICVDTHRAETAEKALRRGADWINDVSGMRDPRMIDVLRDSDCHYILMHSSSVPAGGEKLASQTDPVDEVKTWAKMKLAEIESSGVSLERIIFDPGVGFGKTPAQSITILKRVDELFDLPVRLLIGHSRKAFLKSFVRSGHAERAEHRDPESVGVSLKLAERGCDILRVHNPCFHVRAFHAAREMQP